MPTCSVYCNSVVSLSSIYCASISTTHSSFAGSDPFEGVLGSTPNVICHICHSPGHSTISYPPRYQPKHNFPILVMATFSPGAFGIQIQRQPHTRLLKKVFYLV